MEERLTQKMNGNYTLWYHDVNNDKWDLSSYKKLMILNTYEDLLLCLKKIDNINSGMFFLMKEKITPLWENSHNKKGGYWSFKVNKTESYNTWAELLYKFCFETLSSDDSQITGFSVSPKINNCIFKIWNNDKFNKDLSFLNNDYQYLEIKDGLYRPHQY